jgi:hypothetical protein
MNEAKLTYTRDGDNLVITVEGAYTATGTLSKSGKSHVIASTRGNVKIDDSGLTLGLNLYKKRGA